MGRSPTKKKEVKGKTSQWEKAKRANYCGKRNVPSGRETRNIMPSSCEKAKKARKTCGTKRKANKGSQGLRERTGIIGNSRRRGIPRMKRKKKR